MRKGPEVGVCLDNQKMARIPVCLEQNGSGDEFMVGTVKFSHWKDYCFYKHATSFARGSS